LKQKVKWHVQQLVSRRQCQELRRWLREVETISDTEKLVCILDPKVGENLSDGERRSRKYLVDFQEGNIEISYFQVGNDMISMEDLMNF